MGMTNANLNNLRSLWLIVVMLLCTTMVWGEPVGKEEARQKALSFLNDRSASRARARAASAEELRLEYTSDEYHIFNRGEKDGFVIASNMGTGTM